jgi:hypothetical protein
LPFFNPDRLTFASLRICERQFHAKAPRRKGRKSVT